MIFYYIVFCLEIKVCGELVRGLRRSGFFKYCIFEDFWLSWERNFVS